MLHLILISIFAIERTNQAVFVLGPDENACARTK